MAEEAKDEARTIPAAINRVVIAVFAIYAALPAVALSALPVTCHGGHCQTLLGVAENKGGFAGDPVLGIVKHLHLGADPARRRDLRRPAGRDDPVHRHQRRDHRRLAAGLLDGPAPPGARWAAPPASPLPHALDRDPRLRRDRLPDADPRPGRLPGQHVRVRRDAVVHDRPPGGDPAADDQAGASSGRTVAPERSGSPAASCRCSPCSGALGRSWPSSP